MADGEAEAEGLMAVRPPLRGCRGCRATLRDFHDAPRGLAALLPAGALVAPAVAVASGSGTGRMPGVAAVFARVHEAILGASPVKVSAAMDASSAGKVAAAAPPGGPLGGGGTAAAAQGARDATTRRGAWARVENPKPTRNPRGGLWVDGLAASLPPAGPPPPVIDRTPEPAPEKKPGP